MARERSKALKHLWVVAALVLLGIASFFQKQINEVRADPGLGLTRQAPLENAPPLLAFTTVALGGFRGLIANILWIRANDLQARGKYFEMVQLADWITKLEPHFAQVWVMQAWNMAYNISVKFPNEEDRWRWVQRGIELLRDQGLQYNPRETLVYRELGWFFQHKMGQNLDTAHLYYKYQWALQMETLFKDGRPDLPALRQPATEEQRRIRRTLEEKYKMEPPFIQAVEDSYGPLDWRLPETHAIYWATVGLKRALPKELITLRRVIYQSMHMATLRGRLRLVETERGQNLRLAPNLDIADRANAAYERMIADDTEMRHAIMPGHRSFLAELVFLLYTYNRVEDARRWLAFTRQKYPDLFPPDLSVEEYAVRKLIGSIDELGQDRSRLLVDGLIEQSFYSMAVGEDDRALGVRHMARQIWTAYMNRIKGQEERLGLDLFPEMVSGTQKRLLEPGGMDPLLAARLRAKLGLPAVTNAPPRTPAPAP